MFTEKEYLQNILKKAGHPGRPCIKENIRWVPQISKTETK